jgi:hypothetical protein
MYVCMYSNEIMGNTIFQTNTSRSMGQDSSKKGAGVVSSPNPHAARNARYVIAIAISAFRHFVYGTVCMYVDKNDQDFKVYVGMYLVCI